MASGEKRNKVVSDRQDEWGFYDPEQSGLAAVVGRLEDRSRASRAAAASYAARVARTLRAGRRPLRVPDPTK